MVCLTILQKASHHDAAASAMHAPLPQPHQLRTMSPSTTVLSDNISTRDATSLHRWEKARRLKKTIPPPHFPWFD